MTDQEVEGRLAALEVVARIGFLGFAQRWWGSAYHDRLDGLLDALKTDIGAGTEPAAPTDSYAKTEMVRALERILSTVGPQEDALRKKHL